MENATTVNLFTTSSVSHWCRVYHYWYSIHSVISTFIDQLVPILWQSQHKMAVKIIHWQIKIGLQHSQEIFQIITKILIFEGSYLSGIIIGQDLWWLKTTANDSLVLQILLATTDNFTSIISYHSIQKLGGGGGARGYAPPLFWPPMSFTFNSPTDM